MHQVRFPGQFYLIASEATQTRLRRKAQDHPRLPADIHLVLAELNGRRDGVPATIDPPTSNGGDPSPLVYGETWVMRLYPTPEFKGARRGYRIASVDPLRIHDHHRLAQGYLVLQVGGWQPLSDIRQIPDLAQSYWPRLLAAYQEIVRDLAARAGRPTAQLPPAHAEFLDRIDSVINANERVTIKAARDEKPWSYRQVKPVGERRHGTHPVYDFVIEDDRCPTEGTFVQVRGESDQRGQVTRVADQSVTVRFDQPVDWNRLPKTGDLEATPSLVVIRKQREAAATLRNGLACNGDLLSVLVDHRVRPAVSRPDEPTTSLNRSQREAFGRALGAEDLMVVLGPPGTGKTRVISQIALATAVGAAGRPPARVLVTSHTNRAVDNVLSRLPANLVVVRVGNDGAVTEEGRPYLLETQASQLREHILTTVGASLRGLGDVDVAQRWAAELATRAAELAAAVDRAARAHATWLAQRRAAGGSAQAEVDRLTADERNRRAAIDRLRRRADRNDRLGRRLRWFAGWFAKRAATLATQAENLSVALAAVATELAEAQRRLDELTEQVPEVRAARRERDATGVVITNTRTAALTAATLARTAGGGSQPGPEVRDDCPPAETLAQMRVLGDWLAHQLPLLRQRRALLSEWHQDVSGATDQLYPELIRYADVIAATCVGSASRSELSNLDFELAIVDEAGQIGTADVLIPLVRARRAVLVGDHQQLPPFLDSEVATWGEGIGDPQVARLLSQSALETLVGRLPEANVVPLTEQRRMPGVIADFISAQFYGGQLTTKVERHHRDELFASPFTFVDTARLPEARRRERAAHELDRGQSGCHNPAEARLLARLAAHYHRRGQEWAVIVPYRAQVMAITELLAGMIGNRDTLRLNVGTVDSFQGGERDVILYGFTRSNPNGHIGFLRELRRANVAFTRAKQQLVLVGDLDLLTTALDQPFRDMATALRDHVATRGDISQYDAVLTKLGRS